MCSLWIYLFGGKHSELLPLTAHRLLPMHLTCQTKSQKICQIKYYKIYQIEYQNIPRRSFGQKFLPFSGRAALPVLGRKSAVCRENIFVAANIPFQESSQTKTTYSTGVEYFCGLHWAFLPGTVTAMRKTNLQRLSFHLHLQIWLPSYHILCVFVFEGFLCGMITKGLKSVQS